MPSGESATVRSIERDSSSCSAVRAGDNVAISLQGIDPIHLKPGGVLCHPDFLVAVATRLELKILVLDIKMPIIIGSPVIIKYFFTSFSSRFNSDLITRVKYRLSSTYTT